MLMTFLDVIGFYFLDLATNFKPNAELEAFLEAGEPPVYIGHDSSILSLLSLTLG